MSICDSRSSSASVIRLLQMSHLLTRSLISLSARAALNFQSILIMLVNNIIVNTAALIAAGTNQVQIINEFLKSR